MKKKVYRIAIPIPDCYGEAIAFQLLYVKSGKCPTKEQTLEVLHKLHDRDVQYQAYDGSWYECIFAVIKVEEWPFITDTYYSRNTHVDTKFGSQPLTITAIHIEEI